MRHLGRLGIAAGALAALIALTAGTALAGGWAEVSMTDGSEGPPIAGEEREIRFSLLQHGVTAVDFGEVQLTAVHEASGQVVTVPATNHGGGIWSAVLTFPAGGEWEIGIAHNGLETSAPTMLAVAPPDGLAWLPGAISVGAFGLTAAVVLGSMLLIGRSRPPATRAATKVARAG
jgi:hypothetical protein